MEPGATVVAGDGCPQAWQAAQRLKLALDDVQSAHERITRLLSCKAVMSASVCLCLVCRLCTVVGVLLLAIVDSQTVDQGNWSYWWCLMKSLTSLNEPPVVHSESFANSSTAHITPAAANTLSAKVRYMTECGHRNTYIWIVRLSLLVKLVSWSRPGLLLLCCQCGHIDIGHTVVTLTCKFPIRNFYRTSRSWALHGHPQGG
jgi:hypothetical protein